MGAYRIVLVEDEEIVSLDIGHRLRKLGHDLVARVSTGRSAIAAARRLSPDVVLMDIGLTGDMDGIEAAECIRRDAGVPVVYLTASAEESTVERAKATEPGGYLLKPPSNEELRVAIELAVFRHQSEQARADRWARALAEAEGSGGAGIGGWRFHPARAALVTPNGKEIALSAQEATVVGVLASSAGETVSREAILAALGQSDDRSAHVRLEAVVSRLRRKIRREDPGAELPLRARHSQGYAFLSNLLP